MQVYMELLNIKNEEGPCTLDKLGACKTAHTTQKCKKLSYNDWTCWNNKRKEFIEFSLAVFEQSKVDFFLFLFWTYIFTNFCVKEFFFLFYSTGISTENLPRNFKGVEHTEVFYI